MATAALRTRPAPAVCMARMAASFLAWLCAWSQAPADYTQLVLPTLILFSFSFSFFLFNILRKKKLELILCER